MNDTKPVDKLVPNQLVYAPDLPYINLKCDTCKETYCLKNKLNDNKEYPNIFISNCPVCDIRVNYVKCPNCKKHNNQVKGDLRSNLNTKINCKECKVDFKIYHCRKCICFFTLKTVYEGYILTCPISSCKNEFFNISCTKCERTILYDAEKKDSIIKEPDSMNIECDKNSPIKLFKYIEGQVITCPYTDCNNKFSCVNCFHCFHSNKFEGDKLNTGESLVCQNTKCAKKICKMFCLHCSRMLWYKEGVYHEGKRILCPYEDCKRTLYLVKCVSCNRFNFWDSNQYNCGQTARCGYLDCQKEFAKTDCAHCGLKTIIEGGSNSSVDKKKFRFGVNNTCTGCKKEYTHNVCICGMNMLVKVHYSEAQGIKCTDKICGRDSHNGYCPHCDNIILLNRSKYRFGMTVICPYEECSKKFNYLYCKTCGKGIYYKDNDYEEGKLIVCPDDKCKAQFHMVSCGMCSRGIQYQNRKDIMSTLLKCIYEDCKNEFYLGGLEKKQYRALPFTFNKNGKTIEFIQPKTVGRSIKVDIEVIDVSQCEYK